MKRLNLFLLMIGAALIFSSCSKDEIFNPEITKGDQEISNAQDAKRPFAGICTFVMPEPNTWYDDTDDWRVRGRSEWGFSGDCDFCGTMVLTVDPKNPHDENRGKWEATWYGEIIPTEDGLDIIAYASGVGVEGKVEGLEATWIYTMHFVGEVFPPLDENPTFFYHIEGNIHKPNSSEDE